MSSNKFVNEQNASGRKDLKYKNILDKISQEGVCPFCPENISNYHPHPILYENEYWLVTKNAYPYEGSKLHLLIVHKTHIEDFTELTIQAWQKLNNIVIKVKNDYKISGAALLMRFGETKFTGASVSHLHAQLVTGSDNPNNKAIIARLGNRINQ